MIMPIPQRGGMANLKELEIQEVNDQAAQTPTQETGDRIADASNMVPADPDRCCWPHSPAMNTVEIDIFINRVARFTAKGLPLAQAEALAEKLVNRDREGLDMGTCMECQHCTGKRCTAPARTRLGTPGQRVIDIYPIRDMLQRCPGLQMVV